MSLYKVSLTMWRGRPVPEPPPAPFPYVESTTSGLVTSPSTSHSVNLPSAIESGDILLAIMSFDSNPTITWDDSTAGTWSAALVNEVGAFSDVRLYIRHKVADGTESSKTLSVTSSASEESAYRVFLIRGADAGKAPEAASISGGGASPNPPSLAPTWGATNILWVAVAAHRDGGVTIDLYPADYDDDQHDDRTGSYPGTGVGTSTRQLNASSDDPIAYGLSGNVGHVAATIAIGA